ncbi:MAG: PLP-dependent transferase [Thermoanaerobaculia bacterium]
MRFETTAVRSGGEVDEETGAIAPPIHLSTTFEFGADSKLIHGYRYAREANPTQSRLESALAAIEGGEAAQAFASGMAAGAAVLQSLPAGSHFILPDDCYYAYRLLSHDFLEKWGMSFDVVDMSDPGGVRAAIRDTTRLIWAETPSNPLMKVVDLQALSRVAREAGRMFLVDNTFATPALQQPLALGADVVLHSSTKYLGGHSDVQGGALMFRARDAFFDSVMHTRRLIGGVASPFNSWLVLRGIRSLSARVRVHCENARAVAEFLESSSKVEAVHYPGLESHPGHDVAAKQMSDFGGMISFRVRGDDQDAIRVVAALRLFTRATSLGGVESLVEHRFSTEGPTSPTPKNLIRLSIGLEHPDDLVEDLREALG